MLSRVAEDEKRRDARRLVARIQTEGLLRLGGLEDTADFSHPMLDRTQCTCAGDILDRTGCRAPPLSNFNLAEGLPAIE